MTIPSERVVVGFPPQVANFPRIRYMGSKFRLLSWIHQVLATLDFATALDAFSGSGCVAYLLKGMGKRVIANDFMNFSAVIARATVENPGIRLTEANTEMLLAGEVAGRSFITDTFAGIFFTTEDLRFLDRAWAGIPALVDPYQKSIAIAALVRSCAKRQPRGVFTVAGDPEGYKDGRRDLKLSIREHFLENVQAYNRATFAGDAGCRATRGDVFEIAPEGIDLVYLDPPYVPRSDDNCYIKRYHFLEGLSCYWEGLEILPETRVKKLRKPYTPFSYRRTAEEAFDRLFRRFSASRLVLSYSSNGYPDLATLVALMRRHKAEVVVHEREHRYHFGTHDKATRNLVREYLIVGS